MKRRAKTPIDSKASHNIESLIAASGLPRDICQSILALVDRSGLERDKRLGIVRELVAHFEDGLAAGKSAIELLESFGDANAAGELMARATTVPGAAGHRVEQVWTRSDPFIYRVWRNITYSARRMLQSPGFTATAVLSLAIGIGANTAVFSLVNAILLQKPPLKNPDTLVDLYISSQNWQYNVFSYPDFEDVRDATADVFSAISATQISLVQADRDGTIEMLPVEMVTGQYFSMIGVNPRLGRTLLPEDDVARGAHPVVVLGHSHWVRAFGADTDVVGQQVRLSGRLYTVVGVADEDYPGKFTGIAPAFFLPMLMLNEVEAGTDDALERRGNHSQFVRARLKPGVTLPQAEASLAAVATHSKQEHPDFWDPDSQIDLIPTNDVILYPPFDRFVRAAAWLLTIVTGLVLLIACANLAGFLLARATDRRKEIAVRLALGATRTMLVGQLLTETVLLGLLGGVGGVVLGVSLLRVLLAADLPLPIPVDLDLSLDTTVLGYSLVISLAAGLLFGLAPALQATRPDVAATLKDETPGGGRAGRLTLRNTLVTAQVAISFMLLVAAGLFLRSFVATQAADPGFGRDPAAILTMAVPANRYTEEEGRVFTRTLFDRLEQVPGVEAVGLISNLHLNTLSTHTIRVNIDGVEPPPGQEGHDVDRADVDAGFFDAAGISIRQGRNFTSLDRDDAPPVAIISAALAQKFWPRQDPIGQMLRLLRGEDLRVIGVASDAKVRSLGEAPRPFVYLPYTQAYAEFFTVVAKTSLDADRTALQLVAAARELDPEAWVWEAKSMERHLGIVLLPARLSALMLTVFAGLALLLASVGLYGIVSYAVSQRTHEMGIRMSLGADAGTVIRTLTGSGLKLVALGGAIGLALALLVTRALSNMLFGVGAFDPVTFVTVPALLGGVALLAAYVPARRASRIDPVRALRAE
jgi:predicted permease